MMLDLGDAEQETDVFAPMRAKLAEAHRELHREIARRGGLPAPPDGMEWRLEVQWERLQSGYGGRLRYVLQPVRVSAAEDES